MGKLKAVVTVIILAVILNYLNEPLPDDLPGKLATKLWLASFKVFSPLKPVAIMLGYDEAEFFQSMAWCIAKLLPVFPPRDVTVTDDFFDNIPVKIYTPPDQQLTGRGVMFLHGGGWVMGDHGLFPAVLGRVSDELGAVVVFVDYRLAPQHPFPAAAEDCIASYKYFVKNAAKFNVDPSRIAVMGDSAGGNLAAVISLAILKEKFKPAPKLQVLIYPVLQGSDLHTPSYVGNKDGPFLTQQLMAFFFAAYIFGNNYQQYVTTLLLNNHTSPEEKKLNAMTHFSLSNLPDDDLKENYDQKMDFGDMTLWESIKEKMRSPLFAPLFAESLEGLSPVYITSCHYDVLRDENFHFVKRLRDANVKVKHHDFRCLHTWMNIMPFVKEYYDEYTKIIDYMRSNI